MLPESAGVTICLSFELISVEVVQQSVKLIFAKFETSEISVYADRENIDVVILFGYHYFVP